ncbi:helix-turn-helix transcriptional regulator [Streptomyces sp. NPDC054945]
MTRPMLTQREAAAACGVSRSTIRRRREAGDLPGSVQDPERGWMVPVDDLLAAGFRLNAPASPDQAVPAPAAPSDGEDKCLIHIPLFEGPEALACSGVRGFRAARRAGVRGLRGPAEAGCAAGRVVLLDGVSAQVVAAGLSVAAPGDG